MGWSQNHGRSAKVNADYAKQQGEYAQTEANNVKQFVEDNKTRWLPAVTTVAVRNSTYPNPENGDTVRVTSEAKTYRYVSTTGWVVTDIYDATAIDQVTTQLDENAMKVAGEYNIMEFVGDNKVIDFNVINRAINLVPEGAILKFPTNEYSFDSIVINKSVVIDLQNSEIETTTNNKTIFEVKGTQSEINYQLASNVKRGSKKVYLTTSPSDINVGDLILLRDDAPRATDGNPDMNMETHLVSAVNLVENSITLKDFVRLPKEVSSVSNVYKLIPVENVLIRNAKLKIKEGSTFGRCIYADSTKNLKLSNVATTRSAGSSVLVERSYNFTLDIFEFSDPQVTGSGQGYGVQLFKGVNNFTISNGTGINMRHTFDNNSGYDGVVSNVKAVGNVGACFLISHNGWASDITFRDCSNHGGVGSGFQISAQGLVDPYSQPHYNIRLENCYSQIDTLALNQYQSGIRFDTPVKGSSIVNYTAIMDDGSLIAGNTNKTGIMFKPIDNSLVIRDVNIFGFDTPISASETIDKSTTDDTSLLIMENINIKNCVNAFLNNRGTGKRVTISSFTVKNATTSIFRFTFGDFKELTIRNVTILDSPNIQYVFPNITPNPVGLTGKVENISYNALPSGNLNLVGNKILSKTDVYVQSKNMTLFVTSNEDVTLSSSYMPTGIVEGEIFTIYNNGIFKITLPTTSIVVYKAGTSIILSPTNKFIRLQWYAGKWYEL